MLILAAIHSTFEGLGPPLGTQKSKKELPEADFFATRFLHEIGSFLGSKNSSKKGPFGLIQTCQEHPGDPLGTPRGPKGPLGVKRDLKREQK